MHLNNNNPNILNDMLAATRGIDLKNKNRYGQLTAKKYNEAPKRYPYSSERQDSRQRRKHAMLVQAR